MDDSLELHLDDDGAVSLERTLLHVSILEDLLDGAVRLEQPTFVFIAGGPAAGKGTLRRRLDLPAGAVGIDVDEIRERLPEYERWRHERPEQAADLTHREAAQIAKRAVAAALQLGCNTVLDAVGGDDRGKFSSKVTAALERGFRVRVCYATVPVKLALKRQEQRFGETGRRVPDDVLRAKHAEVSRGIKNIARLAVERIEVFDLSEEEPRLVARGAGGSGTDGLEAVDPAGYAAFLAKGRA